VDSAYAYIEHGDVWTEDEIRQLLDGYGILVPPPPPPPSFDEAMDIPDWWEGFKAFVATEYSSENPDFIDAVRYQDPDPQTIFDTFVADGSERQVNISSSQRNEIAGAFADGATPGHDVFAGAYDEVVGLCRRDSWARYLASLNQG
jgi:hypothetical protein